MPFMRYADTISGSEGKATVDINGEVKTAFYIKSIEATFEKNKNEGKTLGRRSTQHKATGWNGTGSMTAYYVTSEFAAMAQEYADNGRDVYFKITIENEDPTSTVGKQTVVLYDCNLDSTVIAALDVDAESLEMDLDFTFEGFSIIDKFKEPTLSQ